MPPSPPPARSFAAPLLRPAAAALALLTLVAAACGGGSGLVDPPIVDPPAPPEPTLAISTAHLDHLGEDVTTPGGAAARIVHIYADAPSYAWVADGDEGAACIDDAARAAVAYLRVYERTQSPAALARARRLLAFVLSMQAPSGTFYNFVWDRTLRINTTHANSRADRFEWWGARAVWALGEGARVTKGTPEADAYVAAIRRTYPHLRAALGAYGQTTSANGLTFPRWALGETAFDATSELLLGLVPLQSAYPDAETATFIARFSEALEAARFGTLTAFPYGGHASWPGGWHAWGNSQSQALALAGRPASPKAEADALYARLLVDGWQHELPYATRTWRTYEQIAYGVRTVAAGLAQTAQATGDAKYAVMSGLAASWLTGNNAAGRPMYDPATGRGYDGINGSTQVNINSGAESTVEALLTLEEVARVPEAQRWLFARGEAPTEKTVGGEALRYSVFTVSSEGKTLRRGALVLNLTRGTSDWRTAAALDALLAAP